jgi:hypothetical protein
VRRSITGAAALTALLLQGCSSAGETRAAGAPAAIEPAYTALAGDACERKVDQGDPNDTPYLECPGVGGYSLLVRRVEAGRQSVDVVDPARAVHPLSYQDFVTRHMSSLDGRAEWRVATDGGTPVPIALIVRVQAREDQADPERVTTTYLAVARLTPGQPCVTDRIPDGAQALAEARRAADVAREQPCVPPLPGLAGGSAGR